MLTTDQLMDRFSKHLKEIDHHLKEIASYGKPKIIVVTGKPASGKSLLGKAFLAKKDFDKVDAGYVTCICDEPKPKGQGLWDRLDKHLEDNGAIIFLTQKIEMLPEKYQEKVTILKLGNDGDFSIESPFNVLKPVFITSLICFFVAVISTAVTANITSLEVWQNGALSGLFAGIFGFKFYKPIKKKVYNFN